MWWKRSLIYPSIAFFLLAVASTMAVGYAINYAVLKDLLRARMTTRAAAVTVEVQQSLSHRIRYFSRFKDAWLDNMRWLTEPLPEPPGTAAQVDKSTFSEKWAHLKGFFPLWNLDFLLVMDEEGRVTHHLPEDFSMDHPFSAETMALVVRKTQGGEPWITAAPVAGRWGIQAFAHLPGSGEGKERRLVVFGFDLDKIAMSSDGREGTDAFLLLDEDGQVAAGRLPAGAPAPDLPAVKRAVAHGHSEIAFDPGLPINLYHTPIPILDRTLALVVPVVVDEAREVLAGSRERLAMAGLFALFLLVVSALFFNALILSPLRRLHKRAAVMVKMLDWADEEGEGGEVLGSGNEIATLELALKAAATKLYVHVESFRESREIMEGMALKDPLTAFLNRSMFLELLGRALLYARRHRGCVAVVLMDLDHFEPLVAEDGKRLSDVLIQEAAERLRTCLRGEDLLFRIDSQSFASFIPACGQDKGDILTVTARFNEALGRPYLVDGQEVSIGLSIGVAVFPEHGDDVATLVEKAEYALEQVKGVPGRCCQMYEPEQG